MLKKLCACGRYAAHFLAVNGVAVLTSALALARPPFQVIRYALAALEAVTRVCGPAGCDVSNSPTLTTSRLPFAVKYNRPYLEDGAWHVHRPHPSGP